MCYVEAKYEYSSSDPDSNIIYGSNSKVTIKKSKKTWLAPEYIYRMSQEECARRRESVPYVNPLPSLTLQSARNLNVACWPKHSKALLLSSS